jgi:Site-specific recombinase XerD
MANGKIERRAEAIWIEKKSYWQIKVQKNGERKAFTCSKAGKRGKHEAEAKADKWLALQTKEMRFGAAWDAFLAHEKATTGTPNYNKIESIGRLWILPNIRDQAWIASISPAMWAVCVDAPYREKKLSRRTCKNVRTTISGFINFCRRNRWAIEPLERGDIAPPRNAKIGKRTVLNPDALKILFAVDWITKYKRQEKAMQIYAWRLIVVLGLRRGELCGLRREDIKDGILTIKRSINSMNEETAGKNDNARRSIYLPKAALDILADQRTSLMDRGIKSPWLFPDASGDRLDPNHLKKQWDTYRRQHGMGCTLHELRHTFISMVKSDMPAELVKATVGHSDDMDTFGVYGHEFSDDMKRAAGIIDTVITRNLANP